MSTIERVGRLVAPVLVTLALSACEQADAVEAGAPPAAAPAIPAPTVPQVTGQSADAGIQESRETAVVRASERVSPSVVAVNVLRTQEVVTRDPFFDSFFPFGSFGTTRRQLVPSLGSGFVVDPAGLIITNDHVVRGAERILVTFPDGTDAEAELIGTDEATDVAVLRVDGEDDLPTTPIGRTSDLRIGEWVIALGNPFGNMLSNPEPTVTVGVVSAMNRHIVPSEADRGFYLGMIQTDAAINPGNSGGPLVNALGEVVGMNTSIFSRSGGSEGMGFAIPIERVLRIADDLMNYGEVRRAWIGIDVEPEEADAFGRTRGVRVAGTASGSPADGVGLDPGARLLAVNDRRLVTPLDFEAALLDLRASDEVVLSVDGRSDVIRVVADELPSLRAERIRVFEDLELVTVTPAIRSERGIGSEQGALVAGISSQLESTIGIREGDVIVGLNNRPMGSAEELTRALDGLPANSRSFFIVERGGSCCMTSRQFVLGSR